VGVERLYADVEYIGTVYWDAERIDGVWYFEDVSAGFHAFGQQDWVRQLSDLSKVRRHSPSQSGHTQPGGGRNATW
jgi:hypothetical protein